MNKEDFLKLLENAKVDKNGHLYIVGEYKNRIYFCTLTTICEDIMKMVSDPKDHEVYDRHFWNDDTLQCKVVYLESEK